MAMHSKNGRKLGRKPEHEHDARLKDVQKLVVLQMDYGEIADRISEEHNVTVEQARRDIKAVYRTTQDESEHERPMRAHMMRRTMQALYRKVLLAKNFKAAVSILDRLCRLDGLYAATNLVVTNNEPTRHMDLSWMPLDMLKKMRDQAIKDRLMEPPPEEPPPGEGTN